MLGKEIIRERQCVHKEVRTSILPCILDGGGMAAPLGIFPALKAAAEKNTMKSNINHMICTKHTFFS